MACSETFSEASFAPTVFQLFMFEEDRDGFRNCGPVCPSPVGGGTGRWTRTLCCRKCMKIPAVQSAPERYISQRYEAAFARWKEWAGDTNKRLPRLFIKRSERISEFGMHEQVALVELSTGYSWNIRLGLF